MNSTSASNSSGCRHVPMSLKASMPIRKYSLSVFLSVLFSRRDRVDGVIRLAGVRVEQRRHKARILRGGQRQHGKAMLEVGELALLLVRRQISRHKIHAAQGRIFPPPPAPQPDGQDARDRKCRQKGQSSCAYRVCLFLKAACLEMRFTLSAFFLFLRLDTTFFAGAGCSCA